MSFPSSLITQLSDPRLRKRLQPRPADDPLASPVDTQLPPRIGMSANLPLETAVNPSGPRLSTSAPAPFVPSVNRMLPDSTPDRTGLMNANVELPVNRLSVDLPDYSQTDLPARIEANARLAPYQEYLQPGPRRRRYDEAVEADLKPDDRKRNFGQKLLHVLAGIGKGFALGGPGGAIAGGISPGMADRAVNRAFVLPRLQAQANEEEALQRRRFDDAAQVANLTGYTPSGPTAGERQRLTVNEMNRLKQRELDENRDADRAVRLRGQDLTNTYRQQRLAQFEAKMKQGQYQLKVGSDGQSYLVNKSDPNDAAMVTANGEPIGSWEQSLELGRNYRQKQQLGQQESQFQRRESGVESRFERGQQSQESRFHRSEQGKDRRSKSGRKSIFDEDGGQQSTHPSVGKIMQLPDGRKIRVKKIEGGQVTDYEIVP